jgi:hypothetical protein
LFTFLKEELNMANETITFDKIKWEAKKRRVVNGVKNAAVKTINFVEENTELALAIIGFGTVAVGKGYKLHKDHVEKVHQELRLYDPRRGKYVEMKRKPTRKEWMEIERRYDSKESYRQILDDMNLIKY